MAEIKMEDFIKKNILDTVSEKYQYSTESLDYLMTIKGQLINVMKTVDETIEYMIKVKQIREQKLERVYPFDEGDDYWTIEDGEVVWSCWDDVSEEYHDDNPGRIYYYSVEDAKNALDKIKNC